MVTVTESIIKKIAPGCNKAFLKPMVEAMGDVLPAYGIDTPLRVAHFLAQAAHESAGFKTLAEYASGQAYEGRKDLGNVKKGDGRRYKGRGIIQITGRANYRKIGEKLTLPLEEQPELAAQPRHAVLIAAQYWKDRKLNAPADKDDILTITKRINGGYNGLDDRRRYLSRAKNALGIAPVALLSPEAPEPTPAREASPDAPNASGGAVTPASPPDRIKALQKALNERNYDAGREDGSWGSLTRAAVLACQGNNGLPLNAEAIELDDVLAAPAWVIESRQDATLKDLRKEGAPTVKRADLVQAAGGTAVAAGAAEKAGLFDQVGEWAEKAGQVKTWIEPFQGGWLESAITWMTGNFWLLAAIVGGAAAFWFGGRVKARYLDSYKKAETT